MIRILILVLSFLIVGCSSADKFFGIQTSNAEGFKITGNSGEKPDFTCDESSSNPKVYAFGEVDPSKGQYKITIHNNSDSPIRLNYLEDEFKLTDKAGKQFEMEKLNNSFWLGYKALNYPTDEDLKPGESRSLILNSFRPDKGDIQLITAYFKKSDITIALKPIP